MKISKQISILFFCIIGFSCKSLSPDFTKQELKNKGYVLTYGKEQLRIKRITNFIVSDKGVGLYNFYYGRRQDEVMVPVLKFDNDYYLYSENETQQKKVCDSFIQQYKSRFTDNEISKIIERFNFGITYIGKH